LQVSRLFRDIICEDIYLQYLLELDACGYIEPSNPRMDLNYAEKIELLRNHTKRWNHPDSVIPVRCEVPINEPLSTYKFSKGVFAWGLRYEGAMNFIRQIHFLQLPSQNRGTDSKHWYISDVPMNVSHFRADPEQDLLVLFEKSETVYKIHLRSMATGEAHPRAAPAQSTLIHKPRSEHLGFDHGLLSPLCGHLLSATFESWVAKSEDFYVVIWDWTTGEQLLVCPFRIN
jgi:hypothetical protein